MSRSKHQFRPGALEVFETRIVPTVTAMPGIPFVPPGQVAPSTPSTNFSVDPGNTGAGFSITGAGDNTITSTVTNKTGCDRYATFAVYRAPGGGTGTTPTSSENLRSQKLIYSQTLLVHPGAEVTFSIDIRTLDDTGPGSKGDHLTGDDDFQCDIFDAGSDPNGYAPDKLNEAVLDGYIFAGELFNYDDSSPSNNKNHK